MSKSSNRFWSAVAAVASLYLGPAGLSYAAALFRVVTVATSVYAFLESRRMRRNPAERTRQPEITLKTSAAPRNRVYGEARVGGVLGYWVTHGPEQRSLSKVVYLADHEIDSVQDVLADEKSLGALDVNGWVQPGSPWYNNNLTTYTESRPTVGTTMTITRVPVAKATVAIRSGYTPEGASEYATLQEGVDFFHTVPSQTITFAAQWANVPASEFVVTYQINDGTPLVRVRVYNGAPGQIAAAQLVSDSGGEWTNSDVCAGVAYMVVTTIWDETKAAAGIPNYSAIVRGVKVFDPRTGTTYWSPNWALCVADYLKHAFKVTNAEINSADWISSANISDQDVTVDGGSVKRYTCNGVLYADRNRGDNLEELVLAGAGGVIPSGGEYRILCGAYRAPVSITLTDSDLRGKGAQLRSFQPRREAFNLVRGTFYDARPVGGAKLYTRTSYVPYSSAAYLAEDNNEEISRAIDFSMVTDYRVANRLAKQIMNRARQADRITAQWGLRALPLQVGDVVTVTLNRYGIVAKNYEVVDRGYIYPAAIELVLQETAPEVYDWDWTAVAFQDVAPNTLLPDPTLVERPVVTAFSSPETFYQLPDGTIVPYVRLTWPARAVGSEYISARWKRSNETLYRTAPPSRPGETEMRIEPVSGGDVLQILAYAVNSIGARSQPWVIQEHRVDPGLPRFTGEVPALSANLLTNASFDRGAGGWTAIDFTLPAGSTTLEKRDAGAYAVVGSPSSANIVTLSTATGAQYVGAYAERISVTPGKRYVAYCRVIGWDTPAYVAAHVLAENDVFIANYDGNVIPAGAWEGALRWNTPDHYQNSSVFFDAPPGARTVRFYVVGGGMWPAITNPFNARWVSFHKPFFGEIPEGVTTLPPWDPGGHNMIDTALLVPGSTSRLYNARVVNVSPVGNAQVARIAFTCPEAGYCTVNAVVTGKFDYSTVFGGTQSHSIGVDVYSGEYPAGPLVVKNLGESYRVIGQASSAGTYRGTGMTQTQFEVVAGEKLTIFLNYIAPGTSSPVCEDGAMQVEYVYR